MIQDDFKALRRRFVEEWEGTIPVFYSLQPSDERPEGAYAEFFVVGGSSAHYMGGFANGAMRRIGSVVFRIFVPPQQGTALAEELQDAFAAIFRNWTDGTVQCGTEDLDGPVDDPHNGMKMFVVSVVWSSIRAYD